MTDALIKLFIKDPRDVKNPDVRIGYGVLAGSVGIASNALLFTLKLLAGITTGSISILADAANNLSDAGSSVITLIGFKMAGKPADAEHPYGHARMEYIAGFGVSIIILLLGWELAKSSLSKVFNPEAAQYSLLSMAALAVSILVKLWQGAFNRKLGKKIESATLEAAAADSMNDVLATSAVLAGAVVSRISGLYLDAYLGLIVAAFIIWSGIKLIAETANLLIGMAPSREVIRIITEEIQNHEGVIGMHDLVVHNYGPEHFFASAHVEVPAKQDIMVSHDIADNIEYELQKRHNIHLVVHLDPIVTDDEQLNEYRVRVTEILAEISPALSMHDLRMVPGKTHTNLLFDVMVPPAFGMSDAALRYSVTTRVHEIDPTLHVIITVDRNYIADMQ